MKAIDVNQVSLRYRMANDQVRSMKEYLIQAARGRLSYRDFWALRDISFSVQRGDVVGVVGSNGAGKSTLLKVISGILKPTAGSVFVSGTIAPMLELGSGFDHDMTGRENVFLNGAILGYTEAFLTGKFEEIVAFSELGEFIDVPLRNYSSGMVVRLAFSIATAVRPEIMIVDEIMAVGDANFQEKSAAKMKELMGCGTTVLFVSHNLKQIRTLCRHALWLDHGKQMLYGDVKEVCGAYENSLKA